MAAGRIIFLNGTSSSGKSSVARELLDVLDDGVFFHLAVDGFNAMRTKRALGAEELESALRRTRMGFHRSIAAMAEVGNDIVVTMCSASRGGCSTACRFFAPRTCCS